MVQIGHFLSSSGYVDTYKIQIAFQKPESFPIASFAIDDTYPLCVKYSPDGRPFILFVFRIGISTIYHIPGFCYYENNQWKYKLTTMFCSSTPHSLGIDIDSNNNVWIAQLYDNHIYVTRFEQSGDLWNDTVIGSYISPGCTFSTSSHIHVINGTTNEFILTTCIILDSDPDAKRYNHFYVNHPIKGNVGIPVSPPMYYGYTDNKYVPSEIVVSGTGDYTNTLMTVGVCDGAITPFTGTFLGGYSSTWFESDEDLRGKIDIGSRIYCYGHSEDDACIVWNMDESYLLLATPYEPALEGGIWGTLCLAKSYYLHQLTSMGYHESKPISMYPAQDHGGTMFNIYPTIPDEGSLIRSCIVAPCENTASREGKCVVVSYEVTWGTHIYPGTPIPKMVVQATRTYIDTDGIVYLDRPWFGHPVEFSHYIECDQHVFPIIGDKTGNPPEPEYGYPCARFGYCGYANDEDNYFVGTSIYTLPYYTNYRTNIIPTGEGVAVDMDTWYGDKLYSTVAWIDGGVIKARRLIITPCFNKWCTGIL